MQIVDGSVPTGPILLDDKLSMKLFKATGNFLSSVGIMADPNTKLHKMLEQAGGLKDLGWKEGVSVLGKGVGSIGLEEAGRVQIEGLFGAMISLMKTTSDPPMTADELEASKLEVFREAETKSIEMVCCLRPAYVMTSEVHILSRFLHRKPSAPYLIANIFLGLKNHPKITNPLKLIVVPVKMTRLLNLSTP